MKKYTSILAIIYIICSLLALPLHAAQWVDSPLNAQIEKYNSSLHLGENTPITIQMKLHKGYHAYENKFSLSFPNHKDFKIGNLNISPVKEFYDTISKKNKRGIKGSAQLQTIIEIPENSTLSEGQHSIPMHLKYQACTKEFCQFPKTIKMSLDLKIRNSLAQNRQEPSLQKKENLLLDQQINKGWFFAFLFVFIAGILTSLTPCVFPMIPITLAIIGSNKGDSSALKGFILSLIYVLGIATTYSLLGLIAATTGALFGSFLGNIWVVSFIAIVFTLMALSMFGVFEIQTPTLFQGKLNKIDGHSFGRYFKPYIIGMIAGIVASPCVGPVLVSILTYVAQTENQLLGFWLLFTYAIGMGLLFLLIGTLGHFSQKLPKSGPWMNATKFIFGFTMLIMSLYYLKPVIQADTLYFISGIYLIISASLNGAFMENPKNYLEKLIKGFMYSLLIIGSISLTIGLIKFLSPSLFLTSSIKNNQKESALHWTPYSPKTLSAALQSNQPVIVDIYADWCAACKELDKYTFKHKSIVELSKNFKLIKVDATKETSLIKELRQKYQIKGLPTILFFSSKGNWLQELTLTEFEEYGQFHKRMLKTLKAI